jgi:hypothetical protein
MELRYKIRFFSFAMTSSFLLAIAKAARGFQTLFGTFRSQPALSEVLRPLCKTGRRFTKPVVASRNCVAGSESLLPV